LVVCVLLQLRWAEAWLIFVPALLPVFDLTLWSGRLYISEFDLLVLTTASVHFLRAPNRHQFPRLVGRGGVAVVALLLCFGVAALIGVLPLQAPDANELSSYLSNYNALRVAKSLAWGLLFLAPLQWRLANDARRTSTLLILGTSIGLAIVGLAVLWERGVLLTLAQSGGHLYANRYAVLGALLDFTTDHRATALFSEMHTGGEAIDTYLALTPPIAAAGVLALRQPLLRLFCLGALCLGVYAVVATFSRGLYLGFAGGMGVLLLLAAFTARRHFRTRFVGVRIVFGIGIALAALTISYSLGGFQALFIGLLLVGLGILTAALIGDRSRWLALLVLGGIFACGVFVLSRTFVGSHYNTLDPAVAWQSGALISLASVSVAALVALGTILEKDRGSAAAAFVLFAAVASIVIPAAGGTRMFERFSGTSDDALGRWNHWEAAYDLMGPAWGDYVFGMGLGRFPQLYFRRSNEAEGSANYRFRADRSGSWLELGAGDFMLTQKVPLRPNTKYMLELGIRGENSNIRLGVYLCPRLVLYGKGDEPQCKDFYIPVKPANTWAKNRIPFDSDNLGAEGWLGWPITLLLHNGQEETVIDITDVSLNDGQRNIISNGSFAAGSDRWIVIDDIEHLPWHIKNLYLEVFFETGAVGLCVFLSAYVLALVRAVRVARRRDALGLGITGSLVAFAIVGVTGSLFDNPRPATLFFIFLLWVLQPARRWQGERQSHSQIGPASAPIAVA
jgi:hypothetical protein